MLNKKRNTIRPIWCVPHSKQNLGKKRKFGNILFFWILRRTEVDMWAVCGFYDAQFEDVAFTWSPDVSPSSAIKTLLDSKTVPILLLEYQIWVSKLVSHMSVQMSIRYEFPNEYQIWVSDMSIRYDWVSNWVSDMSGGRVDLIHKPLTITTMLCQAFKWSSDVSPSSAIKHHRDQNCSKYISQFRSF